MDEEKINQYIKDPLNIINNKNNKSTENKINSLKGKIKSREEKCNSLEEKIKLLENEKASITIEKENLDLKIKQMKVQLDDVLPVAVPKCRINVKNIWKAIHKGSLLSVNFFYRDNPSSINELFKPDKMDNTGISIVAESTPLHLASQLGHDHIVQFLLHNGVDIDKIDCENYTSLHRAIEGKHFSTVHLLVKLGADKQLALFHASKSGHLDITEFLLINGVDIEEKDSSGQTAFMKAIELGYIAVADLLLTKGANTTNALHIAATEGDLTAIQYLLSEARMNINEIDCDGYTPLMRAVESKYLNSVHLLITRGSDINMRNIYDQSALDLALQLEENELKNNIDFSCYTPIVKYIYSIHLSII